MITAIDSSVLFDVILNDPKYCSPSLASLQRANSEGSLIVCPVVWAELRAALKAPETIAYVLNNANIAFDPFDQKCTDLAGDLWCKYRRNGGKRSQLIPDFLVGAHAQIRADRILTRDRGFLRRYFNPLVVIEPISVPDAH
ncbi:MAG: PIN domain-containing protein [Deltaproteobacteria bacterium]|nr:PIN domain-containing protein [Deltaproteobacteria bacterium]